ncbi:hypothetical protein GUJ93_ZPchr0007g6020 [Zizania palustris]|uniref:Uncharacterized protein n=1 Tax=Zizania palustris TaxID=103762 RepID=A0A8J5T4C0_ZIZPA|nr:hypothetical protein GUJ93_ZPchr0007g6020 [Zizania palustris]
MYSSHDVVTVVHVFISSSRFQPCLAIKVTVTDASKEKELAGSLPKQVGPSRPKQVGIGLFICRCAASNRRGGLRLAASLVPSSRRASRSGAAAAAVALRAGQWPLLRSPPPDTAQRRRFHEGAEFPLGHSVMELNNEQNHVISSVCLISKQEENVTLWIPGCTFDGTSSYLLWAINLLVAAPSVELLCIDVRNQ